MENRTGTVAEEGMGNDKMVWIGNNFCFFLGLDTGLLRVNEVYQSLDLLTEK